MFEIVLIASFTYTTSLKAISSTPIKTYKLFSLAPNSQKLLSEKLRDLRDTMRRHWSLCVLLSPCYLRTPCHAIGHLVIYRECYEFERAFSTLRRFLPYTPSCFFKASLVPAQPLPDYFFESQQSTKELSQQVYLRLTAGRAPEESACHEILTLFITS